MSGKRRAAFVSLTRLLQQQHPELADPTEAIISRRVLVDGRVVDNPRAQVRRSSSVRLLAPGRRRGQAKLTNALDAFALPVTAVVAVDIGTAAGGFTTTLLERGAARVYAVDVGFGQLAGSLRADQRVVTLERTNIAALDDRLVPDAVGLVTIDLSYLSVADAVRFLGGLHFAPQAQLVALVKPTFELKAPHLVLDDQGVRNAVRRAVEGIEAAGWRPTACTIPKVTGAGGAIEAFVLAQRR